MRLQSLAKRLWPGLVNFVPALAYHFCLILPAGFTKPGRILLAEPCRLGGPKPGRLSNDEEKCHHLTDATREDSHSAYLTAYFDTRYIVGGGSIEDSETSP